MSYAFPPDVAALVEARLASGRYASEDDILRDALQALADVEEDVAAIQEALDDLDAGDPGVSVEEAFRRIIARHEQA